ncbi:hypothetical protein XA68_17255 [Ophiocordyceps unilateralis]|uniref:PWI domain-containing protein n=1 Tax=Ophiocordyceps unilateralis TaxID=268505 RepID=A0A2A9PT10_OPHUN|nr:hypothetical protein XA68_17255 [Ophiocordyceps unilateralis]
MAPYNNQYSGNPYGAPPGFGGYGGLPPGMGAAPPGLGPPPGMPPAPGMPAPPGMSPPNPNQANRPGGLPPNFQPPPNLPNINFNAPIIRLGTGAPSSGGRGEGPSAASGGRSGLGMERGGDQGRDRGREAQTIITPPTAEDKLCTAMFLGLPEGVGGDEGVQKVCNALGRLRKWESTTSLWASYKPAMGFATFEDDESIAFVQKLLREETFDVPVKRQQPTANPSTDDTFEGIEKTRLKVAVDEAAIEYQASLDEGRAEDPDYGNRLEQARAALKQVQRELFYPPLGSLAIGDGDVAMSNADAQKNVEVVNISIAQEDELADIPADMREIVAKEIAAFRDRSNQRDMERLRREEEIGTRIRQQNGASAAPSLGGANNIPLGPRAATTLTAPAGPKGQNGADRGVSFVNGAGHDRDTDYDTDASDGELYRRKKAKREEDDEKHFATLEFKWQRRDTSRQSALDREYIRKRREEDQKQRLKEEQRAHDSGWNDLSEATRKAHLYYRENADWVRARMRALEEEETRDEKDRLQERGDRQRAQEKARGQADSFLDRQDQEAERRQAAAAAAAATPAPQPFKLSLGAAAQRAQASRNVPQRRTMAEVEGLLDDEDTEPVVRRPLVPIQPEAGPAAGAMTEEEISQAVRALAQEIPSDKDGLWTWEVKWDYMDDHVVQDRLRPFVEKKIVEYLGVQEEMLVQTVEEQLRKHGTAAALAEELGEALGDEAEDLVKKLWRMVIFFTECEKRSLPA